MEKELREEEQGWKSSCWGTGTAACFPELRIRPSAVLSQVQECGWECPKGFPPCPFGLVPEEDSDAFAGNSHKSAQEEYNHRNFLEKMVPTGTL